MRNLTGFAIRQEYERIKELGDKLVEIGDRMNREGFRPKLEVMFKNNTERGGRPNIDVKVWDEMQRQLDAMNLRTSGEPASSSCSYAGQDAWTGGRGTGCGLFGGGVPRRLRRISWPN